MKRILIYILSAFSIGLLLLPNLPNAWFDETHVAIAKAAGYSKWFNAVGPDMIKEKMGNREGHNHFVNNSRGTIVTPEFVLAQVEKYNKIDSSGHLYGAIISSTGDYIKEKKKG